MAAWLAWGTAVSPMRLFVQQRIRGTMDFYREDPLASVAVIKGSPYSQSHEQDQPNMFTNGHTIAGGAGAPGFPADKLG